MTYSGTMIQDLEASVERARENARQTHLYFENNSALRIYLYDLALRIVERASEPVPQGLATPDFLKQTAMKLGMVEAAPVSYTHLSQRLRPERCDPLPLSR